MIAILLLLLVLAGVLVYDVRRTKPRRHSVITFEVTVTTLQPGPDNAPTFDVFNAKGVIGLPALLSLLLGLARKSR